MPTYLRWSLAASKSNPSLGLTTPDSRILHRDFAVIYYDTTHYKYHNQGALLLELILCRVTLTLGGAD